MVSKNPNSDILKASSLARIRSRLPALAAAEQKVAQWVLQHTDDVTHMSMAQVARECGVSDTTVLRFCRAVGFQGYTDMKLSIVQDLATPTQLVHDDISEQDDALTIARKVFLSNMQALQDTMEILDGEALMQAVDMLADARLILIIGVGTSRPIMQDMYHMLFRLGLNVRAQPDSYLQLMEAALVGPEDVVVGISQSGASTDPVLTMAEAKRNGAHTIVITGNDESPITQYADVTLVTISRETRAETIASRIAQMTLVDALYVILSMRMLPITTRNENKIWKAIIQSQKTF
ncbi:MAG TPA: MurR/RpiR family transcriptional regulator [Anaerolineae bacterium]|nr:MurR/RpiR family transcriptional regulator [Anaerolineae bacterium]